MKRSFRLARNSDFQRVRRMGKSYAHPLIVLITTCNDLNRVRIGVTASAAVGNAVQRNFAKRRLRAAILPWTDRINPGMDVILIARQPLCQARFESLTNALQRLIQRAGLVIQNDEFENPHSGD